MSASNLGISTRDLVNRINAIEAFGGNVSATLGGTEADPSLTKIAPPYAWVLYSGSQTESQERERWTKLRHNYAVHVALAYGLGEDNFTETQMPLIEQIGQAVTGMPISELQPKQITWAFDGMSIIDVEPTVVRYEMLFSCPSFYTQST